jgi:hypothetical protein
MSSLTNIPPGTTPAISLIDQDVEPADGQVGVQVDETVNYDIGRGSAAYGLPAPGTVTSIQEPVREARRRQLANAIRRHVTAARVALSRWRTRVASNVRAPFRRPPRRRTASELNASNNPLAGARPYAGSHVRVSPHAPRYSRLSRGPPGYEETEGPLQPQSSAPTRGAPEPPVTPPNQIRPSSNPLP